MSADIPPGWHQFRLEDCVEVLDSLRVPVNNDERQSRIEGKPTEQLFPYYGATGQVGFIDDFLFDEELVALGEDGVPFLDPLKSKAYMLRGKTWVNNHAHVLRSLEGVAINKFVFYYLNQFDYQGYVNGGTRLKLTQANMRMIPVPLPPLAEQTRIAAKLDELLAQVDTLKARVDGIPALLKRFRQSVLAAAVSGRLTEEWRVQNCPTPPTAPSPNKYSLSKEELKKFADLHNLPHVWECASAAEVCGSVRDGTHDTPAYHLSGIPLVTSKNIGSGFVDTKEAKLISIEDHLEISKRSLVEHGDVLFSMIGTVGNCCVVREQDSEFSIKNVGLFKKNEPVILPRFLEFWLNSQVMWSWLEKNLKGSSQKFASLGTLRAMPVFLPSLQEQTEIVRRVEQLFAFADQLEAKVASAKSRIDHLTQSILAKAFRGELVPQDPNDEPASLLLERIKTHRAAAPKAKRGRKASA